MSRYLVKKSQLAGRKTDVVQHQFNANAIRHTQTLTAGMGLDHLGIHMVRIEPGRDSTTHHYHEADEEFIYVVSGEGTARIGDETFAIEAGDFMAFPINGPAHSLHNSSDEDLVYLMGGERNLPDIVHYPDLKRSLFKSEGRRRWTEWSNLGELPPR